MLRLVVKRFGADKAKRREQSRHPNTDGRPGAAERAEVIPGSIPVEVFDDPGASRRSWRSGAGEWTFDSYLEEEHHRQYGRPWCIGRGYFDFLIDHGVRPEHHVLDFGCGAGRLGILLIPYLEPGHYFGIDRHFGSLDAFARYEIPLHRLAHHRPRLALSDKLRLDGFGTTFDVVLDLYVSHHMSDALSFYDAAANVLNPDGRIFVPHVPKPSLRSMAALGLEVVHTEKRPAFLLSNRGSMPSPHGKQWSAAEDHWHILQKLPATRP